MDPLTLALAGALAGAVADQTIGATWAAVAKLVRQRLGRHPGGQELLAAAREHPNDTSAVAQLADALSSISTADPDFAATLRTLWPQAREELARAGAVNNTVSGLVFGSVYQARDVTIHQTAALSDSD